MWVKPMFCSLNCIMKLFIFFWLHSIYLNISISENELVAQRHSYGSLPSFDSALQGFLFGMPINAHISCFQISFSSLNCSCEHLSANHIIIHLQQLRRDKNEVRVRESIPSFYLGCWVLWWFYWPRKKKHSRMIWILFWHEKLKAIERHLKIGGRVPGSHMTLASWAVQMGALAATVTSCLTLSKLLTLAKHLPSDL